MAIDTAVGTKGNDKIIPHSTADTTLAETTLDLLTGVDLLINSMSTLAEAIMNSQSGDLMEDFTPMHWIALRLKNDVAALIDRVDTPKVAA